MFGHYCYVFRSADVHIYCFPQRPHSDLLLSLIVKCYCVCPKRVTLCNCLCSFTSFSGSHIRDFKVVNPYSWFWKSLSIYRTNWWVRIFPRCSRRNWYENWYLHFHKTYNHQIRQADTSRGVESNETNHAGADGIITSRPRDKIKTLYLHYQISNGHQTW